MRVSDYEQFLATKRQTAPTCGFEADPPNWLYPFQRDIFTRAITRGRSAIFADCGLGKTPVQLAWADAVRYHTGGRVLIVAPLAVSSQTCREGVKFGVAATHSSDGTPYPIAVTNYERLHHFDPRDYAGIVLDESSILKSFGGKMRQQITEFAMQIKYRLACTATPAPNDYVEILNHAEFLDVMTGKEAIALFFRQDGNTTQKWRVKRHAEQDWWAWLASWATACRKPSDLGYSNGRFLLPKLRTHTHTVDGHIAEGWLFPVEAVTLDGQRQAARETISERVRCAADLVNVSDNPWLVWCNLNAESEALRRAIPDAVEVRGSDDADVKSERVLGFSDGKYRVIVTKPSIAGFGMNWQHCSNMAFVGLSHSFEQYYQATRRCWRFGQENEVNAHIIICENDGPILANIQRKERDAARMMGELVAHMNSEYGRHKQDISTGELELPSWLGITA